MVIAVLSRVSTREIQNLPEHEEEFFLDSMSDSVSLRFDSLPYTIVQGNTCYTWIL